MVKNHKQKISALTILLEGVASYQPADFFSLFTLSLEPPIFCRQLLGKARSDLLKFGLEVWISHGDICINNQLYTFSGCSDTVLYRLEM